MVEKNLKSIIKLVFSLNILSLIKLIFSLNILSLKNTIASANTKKNITLKALTISMISLKNLDKSLTINLNLLINTYSSVG